MSSICIVCDKQAVRVCVHPTCDKVPFLCGDDCKFGQNLSEELHTHNNQTRFVPYSQMMQKITSIQDTTHTHHINQMKRRVNVILHQITSLMTKYERAWNNVELRLNNRAKTIIGNILTRERNKLLNGNDILDLLETKSIYEGQEVVDKVAEIIRKQMDGVINKLEAMEIRKVLNYEKAEEYWRDGIKLTTSGKEEQAINSFVAATELYPIEPKYIRDIGCCYYRLDNSQKALKCYQQGLSLSTKSNILSTIYNNIGNVYFDKKDFEKGVQCFSKAIELDKEDPFYFYNRGNAYSNLKQYKKAVGDYSSAIQINGLKRFYNQRADAYEKLGEMNKVKADWKSAQTAADD